MSLITSTFVKNFLDSVISNIGTTFTLKKFKSVNKNIYGEGTPVYDNYTIKGIVWYGVNEELARQFGIQIQADINIVTNPDYLTKVGLPLSYSGYNNSVINYNGEDFSIVQADPIGILQGNISGFLFLGKRVVR